MTVFHAVRRTLAAASAMLLGLAPGLARPLEVACTQGCRPGGDMSVNLLFRGAPGDGITLTWTSPDDPATLGGPLVLYAGNPAAGDVPDRGALLLEKAATGWSASRSFTGQELGSGTFLAVVVARPPKKDPRIVDWRAFHLLTEAELARARARPAFADAWAVDVKPALLTASTGHGELPPRMGGGLVWWSFGFMEGNTTDLDLDGRNTGIPGLGVQVANPWHTSAGESLPDRVRAVLTGTPERAEQFQELKWFEVPDRKLEVAGEKVVLRDYYTVVTLYTQATSRSFDEESAGGHNPFLDPRYFSHETSARLDAPFNPRFFSSYDERVYGEDATLVDLIGEHVRSGREVPGLPPVQSVDGDGGGARYTVGFFVSVKPWAEPPDDKTKLRAGIVALDVIAARTGVGGALDASADGRGLVCKVIGCGKKEGTQIDLHSPPAGYSLRGSPYAALGSVPGELPMTLELPDVAQRTLAPEGAPAATPPASGKIVPPTELPLVWSPSPPSTAERGLPKLATEARFGLTATLRSGLLTRNAWWGKVADVYPINAYAQYVVRITVAMAPEAVMPATDQKIIPDPKVFTGTFVVVQTLLQKLRDFFALSPLLALLASAALLLVLLAVLSIWIPGLRPLVGAVVKIITGVLKLVGKAVDWIVARVGRKEDA